MLIGDKNSYGKAFEADLADNHIELLRPTRKGRAAAPRRAALRRS